MNLQQVNYCLVCLWITVCPKSVIFPEIQLDYHDVPCQTNPLGVKGAGEGGTAGATPAIISAILDALGPLGVTTIEVPATPTRIWKAIQEASGL